MSNLNPFTLKKKSSSRKNGKRRKIYGTESTVLVTNELL